MYLNEANEASFYDDWLDQFIDFLTNAAMIANNLALGSINI